MAALTKEETEALIQEVLEIYPEQAKKDRAKHLAVNDQSLEKSNKWTDENEKFWNENIIYKEYMEIYK